MSSVIGQNMSASSSTAQLLNNIELQDYLLYESSPEMHMEETGNTDNYPTGIKTKKANQEIEDISIPKRSPRRPIRKNMSLNDVHVKQNVSSSPCSVLESSSFEYRNDDSEKSSNESIFSNDGVGCDYGNGPILDEFGLDLEGIDDLDLFLNELEIDENGQSNIVFQVDDVINIVAIHSQSDIRPISYIGVN